MKSAILCGLLALVLVPSCSPSGTELGSQPDSALWAAALGEAWERLQVAPHTTPFQGVRRVAFHVPGPDKVLVEVEYEERVSSNGAGGFAIRPLAAKTAVFPDEQTFLLLQEQRQGFFFRYRDFQVRDTDQFLANFKLVGSIQPVVVAGRPCMEAHLLRLAPGGHHYRVAFDSATGLPLSYVEFDDAGNPVASMVFESIDFAPSHSGVAFFEPTNIEVPFGLEDGVAESILGFTPRLPKFVPQGFALIETAKVQDHLGRRWIKLGYTDGIEMLFFLHRAVEDATEVTLPVTARVQGEATRDEVLVFEAGPVTVAQGVVDRNEFIAVGEVGESDLLHMIDSALD